MPSTKSFIQAKLLIEKYFSNGENVDQEDEIIINELDQINNLAKTLITSLPTSLNPSIVDIDTVIDQCMMMHTYNAYIRGINIIYRSSIKTSYQPFYADELYLKQIIVAIIFICIKYMPQGGKIKIRSERIQYQNHLHLCISIEDTGLPLSGEDIERLEDRFTQNQETSFIYNIKMSFKFIKKLAEIQNGFITCERREFKRGKMIKIFLPFKDDMDGTVDKKDEGTLVGPSDKYLPHDTSKKVIH